MHLEGVTNELLTSKCPWNTRRFDLVRLGCASHLLLLCEMSVSRCCLQEAPLQREYTRDVARLGQRILFHHNYGCRGEGSVPKLVTLVDHRSFICTLSSAPSKQRCLMLDRLLESNVMLDLHDHASPIGASWKRGKRG